MTDSASEENYPRRLLSFIVFSWLVIIFINRVYTGTILHQLQQPVLIFPQVDNTYWIFHYFQIPEILSQHQCIAVAFDVSIFTLLLLCLSFAHIALFPLLLSFFMWAYFISFNTFAGHHYSQTGLLFIILPFIASDGKNFNLLFEGVRYYCCFIYVSSGTYKLFRGALVNREQMASILMNDNTDKMYHNPNSFIAETTGYLIQHAGFSQGLFVIATILELFFILGFFTKKFDLLLLGSVLTFHVANYLLLGMPFLEQSIIFLTLISKERWISLAQNLRFKKQAIERQSPAAWQKRS